MGIQLLQAFQAAYAMGGRTVWACFGCTSEHCGVVTGGARKTDGKAYALCLPVDALWRWA